MKKIIIVLLTILLMLATRYIHAETISNINIDITVQGQGSIAVVFEAGGKMSKDTRQTIASKVSDVAISVTYSPADIGRSKRPTEVTVDMHINDLHGIIMQMDKAKPVVLVGLCDGGLLITALAQQYPALVKV